ncbi:MAG: Holliday junction branch migration protein RuvA, partial [Calditrichaeota bacterium]
MIARLMGVVLEKTPTRAVLDVNGVGYELSIPVSTFEKLNEIGQTATLLTHLHVREDAMQLFGFATDQEKGLFSNLVSVSGVGPKLALAILSGRNVDELKRLIVTGDVDALTRISGVGKKTAQRLVMELREKLEKETGYAAVPLPAGGEGASQKLAEAVLALVSLGYNKGTAERLLGKM